MTTKRISENISHCLTTQDNIILYANRQYWEQRQAKRGKPCFIQINKNREVQKYRKIDSLQELHELAN